MYAFTKFTMSIHIKYWPEDGSPETKNVAKLCTFDYILVLCLTQQIIL